MENQASTPTATLSGEWNSVKVYTLGAICLVLGIALGALFHGPGQPAESTSSNAASAPAMPGAPPQMPQGMAQGAAVAPSDPVFEKVKNDPNNFDLLSEAGNVAMKGGDPKMAADYYGRALKVKDDLDVRTNLANAYFRAGDADQSLAELALVLKADPKNDKALYNTGVVRLMGKRDAKGAVSSWETFLKYHPDNPHKAQVQEMIKRAKQLAAEKKI
jgi:cytochrome c-type biogenesis protein CcmH/NrfG